MTRLNLLSLTLLILLSSCSSHEVEKPKEGTSLNDLYERAMDFMLVEKDYKKAAKAFENVERFYPLSPWAMKSQLMAAYAYYQSAQYEQAIANLENFLQSQSNSDYAPYAQYLLGLCYYIQITGVERDQTMTYKALKTFRKVVQKYPKTIYARDARLKIDLCKEHLAGQDMEIGRFYLNKKIPTAALQRFLHVVQSHQTTSHAAEALYRCVEVFLTLGMKDEALKHAAVLGYNYPGNKWYQSTYDLLESHDLIKKHQSHLAQKKNKGDVAQEK